MRTILIYINSSRFGDGEVLSSVSVIVVPGDYSMLDGVQLDGTDDGRKEVLDDIVYSIGSRAKLVDTETAELAIRNGARLAICGEISVLP